IFLLSCQTVSNITRRCHNIFHIRIGVLVRLRYTDIHPAQRRLCKTSVPFQISPAVTDGTQTNGKNVFGVALKFCHTFPAGLTDRVPPVIIRMLHITWAWKIVWTKGIFVLADNMAFQIENGYLRTLGTFVEYDDIFL